MFSVSQGSPLTGLTEHQKAIERALDRYTRPQAGCPTRLTEAIRYSVLAPGKRMRPLLALIACQSICGRWQDAVSVGCAVEFIHAYSLIHDDLPAMDDDDLRRGQPTCHKQFDEATAILAGDCLQMLAFEVICQDVNPVYIAACCQILAGAAGRCRLVGGQADDLAAEGRFGPVDRGEITVEHLQSIHRRKTGAIIEASLQLGAVVAGGSQEQLQALSIYGQSIGLAFQIIDDCLDLEATSEQLGKTTRKDSSHGKLTYPALLGLEHSHELATRLVEQACEAIRSLDRSEGWLEQLARFVLKRKR